MDWSCLRPRGLLRHLGFVIRVTRAQAYKMAVNNESFMNGSSSTYLEEMYNLWMQDPRSVHASWDTYFKRVKKGAGPGEAYMSPPTITPSAPSNITLAPQPRATVPLLPHVQSETEMISKKVLEDHLAVQNIVRAYQQRGHLVATVDPLGLAYGELYSTFEDRKGMPPKRVVRDYMMSLTDSMDKVFQLPTQTFIGGRETHLTLREIIQLLERVYCGNIGIEYKYITPQDETLWLSEKFETPGAMDISIEEKRLIVKRLVRSVGFEAFLAKKWVSEKRFGLEGCDVLIPAVKTIIDHASSLGTDKFVIGMSHRGRLNCIANVLRQPLYKLFTHFSALQSDEINTQGDVKYHLGVHVARLNRVSNKQVGVMIVANPSHLETVDPIVMGKVRAEQFFRGDLAGKKVLGILIHGDAAFCGQGVVFESFHLSHLPDYTPRGIIHIVVNNQIGFTTDPRYSRSSAYCTDVGRVTQAPIFHVNADDPEAVINVCKVAIMYRTLFHQDVVIDLVCYRRNGHNEIDEPSFTQPFMYKKIRSMPNVLEKYSKKLVAEGVITAQEVTAERETYEKICETHFQLSQKETHIKWRDWIDTPWKGFFKGDPYVRRPTGIDEDILQHIGMTFASPPPAELGVQPHKGLGRVLKAREEMIKAREIDWAIGEALAFGSLLKEGIHVRLSGQDVERGTFSHRHHVIHCQEVDKKFYVPLQNLYPGKQAEYTVCNSSISEMGVLGYEIGFSTTSPNCLVIWEAQFGDFSNGGQVMIDQILCSGEAKWIRQSGLVMLNPHGMEGMGPEHSSARVERFLLMCDDDPDRLPDIKDTNFYIRQLRETNWIVANCSTPANLFHILRRQILLPFRKPLIIFSPKLLLRHPRCRSSFDDMKTGTEFQRIIPEQGPASKHPDNVKKHIFSTGKVYYDLMEAREEKNLQESIALTRLEQLCPFPYDLLQDEVKKYPNAELCWTQEEHKNMGAWNYILPRFSTALDECEKDVMSYAGRVCSSSPATGSKLVFKAEQHELLEQAMSVSKEPKVPRLVSSPK